MSQRIAYGSSIFTDQDVGSKRCFPLESRRFHGFIVWEKESLRGQNVALETDLRDGTYSFASSVLPQDVLPEYNENLYNSLRILGEQLNFSKGYTFWMK